ncbi:hypothetical protein SmJEL517_g03864 [Synchytrium microbalum]|uniref:Uncharacterized protein n=1 Tax=Synchytrium microbalum TaxID=1806994 RepID=A0A507C1J6_9FUNG|nr:uncharacterized protein SmJEL517_g03864 [Synchytrium microbalum]TPX33238.1 hypothetical protein SmJEL517_g03864 [Synchytrium microbalum]
MDWQEALPALGLTTSSKHGWNVVSQPDASKSRRLMATRQSELVIALPGTDNTSRIRTLPLRELKRACMDQQDSSDSQTDKLPSFKELDTPKITFTIRQMEMNPKSSLLAVAGDHDLVVLVLPQPGTFASSKPPESHIVGELHHSADQTARIARLLWHPHSLNGTCLMVLSTDGNLRLYDIQKDLTNPKQTIPVFKATLTTRLQSKSNHFGLDDNDDDDDEDDEDTDEEAVSMCLGEGLGWGRYTAYVVTKTGTMYSICPVMPTSCEVDLSHLAHLDLLLSASTPESQEQERQIQCQRNLLEELRRSASKSANLPTEKVVVIAPPRGLQHLKAQSRPCRLVPQTAGSRNQVASDIVYMPADPMGMLVVAYNGGGVDLLLEIERPQPWWKFEVRAVPIVLAVQDRLDLSLNNTTSNTPSTIPSIITKDPKYTDTLYITHESGMHRIRLSAVFDELRTLKSQARVDALKSEMEVDWVVNTRGSSPKPSPPLGLVLLTDVYLSYSYIFLHSSLRLHGQPLPLRLFHPTIPKHMQDKLLYPKYLPAPFQVPAVLQHDLPRIPQMVRAGNMTAEDALRFIADVGGKVIEEVAAVEGACDELRQRLYLQNKEFELQSTDLQRLKSIIQTSLHPGLDRHTTRLADLIDAQEAITARADIVLQILTDRTQPQLSPEERGFIREVSRVMREVKDKSSKQIGVLKQRVESIIEQSKKQLLGAEDEEVTAQSYDVDLGTSQAKRVKEALKVELELLKDARNRVNRIWDLVGTS